MKLRNKKTGEIKDAGEVLDMKQEDGVLYKYYSLAKLNAEWEDVKEPKEYWWLDYGGRIKAMNDSDDEEDKTRKQIGNYFETKEEAEKAVEKLKAWKRLKDAGFSFTGFEETDRGCLGDFTIYCYTKPDYTRPYDDVEKDLDLLFGGEE